MSRTVKATVGLLAVLLTAGLVAQSFAQNGGPGIKKIGGKGEPGERTLFILVRINPKKDVSREEMEYILEKGAKDTDCKYVSLNSRPLLPSVYHEIEAMATGLRTMAAPTDEKSSVRQIPGGQPMWEISLHEGGLELTKLVVVYKKAGTKDYEPANPRIDRNAKLLKTLPGTYVLRPEIDDQPLKYTIHFDKIGVGKQEPVTREWPKYDRYYVVTIHGFKGESEKLLDYVRKKPNETLTFSKFDDVELGQNVSLVFASLGASYIRPPDSFFKNKYIATVPVLDGAQARRVWILFPLTAAECDRELEKYRAAGFNVSRELRKAKTLPYNSDDVELTPTTEPRWIELKEGTNRLFSRTFVLRSIKELPKRFPDAWQLVLYEYGEGDGARPFGIEDQHGNRGYVRKEEIKEWPSGIRRASEK